FIATVVGARVGHCLFYEFNEYIQDPIRILYVWEGGLASHGAALGLLVGIYLFSKKNHFTYIWSLDRITTVIPIGGAFIRLGNLMNSEIYGTPTDLPWGFIFVRRQETLPMHPTQIYEALIYFLIFGLLGYLFFKKNLATRRPGALFGIFLITLFGSRFFVEMIKNVQESFEQALTLNMGQILSIPFVALGVIILILAYRKKPIFKI
ncbi:MAG: prolipoprotein diacylglyceryl transferase, partial [Rikenellaceae bacterium]